MPFNILMIVKRMFNLTFNYHLTMDIKPPKREISETFMLSKHHFALPMTIFRILIGRSQFSFPVRGQSNVRVF